MFAALVELAVALVIEASSEEAAEWAELARDETSEDRLAALEEMAEASDLAAVTAAEVRLAAVEAMPLRSEAAWELMLLRPD